MKIIQLFILQFLAHLLSDFIFQPQSWCDKKESRVFTRIHLYHAIIVLVTSYVLSFDLGFWKAALVMTLFHFLIDIVKSFLLLKSSIKYLYFIDQLLHLITIILVVLAYNFIFSIDFLFEMEAKTLAIIAGFLFCAKPANITIKYLLSAFSVDTPAEDPDNNKDKSLPNAGKLIGITERFLTLALILLRQYEAVGLIIAAKSILRFNATQKSEYVLIGTLLSFSMAVLAGIIINTVG
jgi:hypothetical protein